MPIRLHDSLTRSLKELRRPDPNDPKDVFRFYNCGPTVYAPAHIGNFRTFVINDVIRRLLQLEFGHDKVKHVRNLTDVDDKTIARAREEGRPLADVTKQWTEKFHADCVALNCLPPHVEPAATGHIHEQVDMIDVLMKKGNAYRAADGSVYFKVSSFDGYGALSRVKERELQIGSALKAAAADADEKEDLSDFALWKSHKPDDGDNSWDSPWGRGRPGWHIECSAMSKKHLGDTIDLHSGGVDLLFPHHENEIAQSQCCNGQKFSHHWYHSEHLLVDGKKMSKSLGNLYTLEDLVINRPFTPMAVRYSLLAGHPRKQLNFTLEALDAAKSAVQKLERIAEYLVLQVFYNEREKGYALLAESPKKTDSFSVYEPAWKALCDDLNTPEALAAIFDEANSYNSLVEPKFFAQGEALQHLIGFRKILFALGFLKTRTPASVIALAEKRWAARLAKDFAGADALRKELAAAGWSMLDGKKDYQLEPLKK